MSAPSEKLEPEVIKQSQARFESPARLKERAKQLVWHQEQLKKQRASAESTLKQIEEYLAIADDVTLALETLSAKLFNELVGTLEEKITLALQDILGQPIKFRAIPKTLRKATVLEFSIERDGNEEDARRAKAAPFTTS